VMGVVGAPFGLWLARHWAAILVGVAVLQWGYGVYSPNVPKWLGLYLCSFVLGLALARRSEGGWRSFPPDAAALLLLLWMALSLIWSPDWHEGLIRLQNAVTLFVIYLYFSRRGAVPWDAIAVTGIGLSLLRPDIFGGLGNTIFQSEFLLLLVPWCRWYVAIAVFVFLGVFEGATLSGDGGSDVVWPALALWCLWVARKHVTPYRAALVPALAASGYVMWAWGDWSALEFVMRSMSERAEIWTNTAYMVLDEPTRVLHGVGLGGFMYWYPFYQESHLALFDGTMMKGLMFFTNAVHNDWLQIFAVLGSVGLLFSLSLTRLLFLARGNALFLLMAGLLMFFNFPLQNPASAAVVAMGCGVINAIFAARSDATDPCKWGSSLYW